VDKTEKEDVEEEEEEEEEESSEEEAGGKSGGKRGEYEGGKSHPGELHSHTMFWLGCYSLECQLTISRDQAGFFWSCCGQNRESENPCTVRFFPAPKGC
jgi:hypothetical protein